MALVIVVLRPKRPPLVCQGGAIQLRTTHFGKIHREEPLMALEAPCAFADAGQLAEVKSAAQYLHARRDYKGLETPHHSGAEAKEASLAVPGRSGRAAHYVDEPDRSKGRVDALRKIHS